MKNIILLFFLYTGVSCLDKKQSNDKANVPVTNVLQDSAYSNTTELKFISKKIRDFGEIDKDSTLIADYEFVNIGDFPLLIDYVNPDCTCTSFELSSDSIAPGDSGNVRLVFNTEGRTGTQKIYATMKSNTSAKFHRLMLKVTIN